MFVPGGCHGADPHPCLTLGADMFAVTLQAALCWLLRWRLWAEQVTVPEDQRLSQRVLGLGRRGR